ncbi:MAG: glycine cleavage system protein GcvH [Candidatus Hadarchaeum sp.]|uniref:glycine cleavage system protein GcvH n=1 Tax=Candidatus Hadarchaeum sp. TaxID=2883567 RepID=UPI003D122124
MATSEYEVREGFFYSKEHEWVKVENGQVRVGITDYAQDNLGDVVYVELPVVGRRVKQIGEPKSRDMELGAVESVKAVSTVYSPISGEVKEVNKALQERPELVNTSPYDEGWICTIAPSALDKELKLLMDAKAYSEYLKKLE